MKKLWQKGVVQLSRAIKLFATDSLFRNAIFLMASTAIMSVLGFGFWIFVAHLYSAADIGLASSLISITLLISNLSFFGLNAGFVRFLPTSKHQSRDINASLIAVAATTIFASIIYLLVGNGFHGALSFFTSHLANRSLFLVLMVAVSLNTFTDSIFIANRRAEFHTLVYAAFGLVKLLLPLFLIPLGSLGIFLAYVAAAVVSLALSFVFMWLGCGYRFLAKPNWNFIHNSRRYTTNNYVASLVSGLPSQLMPSLIITRLGEANAAYFSMAWTMANVLYVIPSAFTNSLLAETSHDISAQSRNILHATRILSAILVPAVSLAIIVAPFLLRLFGPQYSAGGAHIFQLLALSTFFIAANSIGNTIMNLEHRSGGIVLVQGATAIAMLGLAWPLMKYGLVGVGIAMLAGTLIGNLVQLALLIRHRRTRPGPEVKTTTPSAAITKRFLAYYQLEDASVGTDIGGGDRSGTMIIDTPKQKYVLKLYNATKHSRVQLEEEIAFTNFLIKRNVPAPKVVPDASGALITEFSTHGTTWLGMLMRFETGGHPSEFSPRLLSNMAHVQARIHTHGVSYAKDYQANNSHPGGSLGSTLVRYAPKGVSHFDYYHGNLLAEGDRIICILDFEGMRYDPIVVCLFFTLTTLYTKLHDKAKLEHYLRSYQKVRKLRWPERLTLRFALFLRYRRPKLLLLRF